MDEKTNNNIRTRRSIKPDAVNTAAEMGKMPPQSAEVEESVLGAMLLGSQAVNDAIDILQPESFYKVEHQKIFSAILQLFGDTETIDILTVSEKLRKIMLF